MIRPRAAGLVLSCILIAARAGAQERHPKNDYPTAARADYVIGCMAANSFNCAVRAARALPAVSA